MIKNFRHAGLPMFNPPHPGEILKEDVMPEIGFTVGNFAAHLGISRPHFSKILNGRASITAEGSKTV